MKFLGQLTLAEQATAVARQLALGAHGDSNAAAINAFGGLEREGGEGGVDEREIIRNVIRCASLAAAPTTECC